MTDINNIDEFCIETIRRAMLERWDPIGVRNIVEARDEYDDYALALYDLLLDGKAKGEIFDYLWWLETHHMGLNGNRDVTERFSEYLVDLRQRTYGREGGEQSTQVKPSRPS